MSFFRFLVSKHLWLSVVAMMVIVVGLIWGTLRWLNHFTLQEVTVTLPNLQTYSLSEAEDTLLAMGLRYDILDSNEYFPDFPRSSVIDQYPEAGVAVKPNRRISLTLNAKGFKKVPVPDVIEKTRRRALYDLESKGFVIGTLEYVPYIGKDVVVGISHKGTELMLPTELTQGSTIDLIIGMGLSSERVRVPYLKNMSLEDARDKLNTFSLNVGALVYDDDLEDTAAAFVFRQSPVPSWEPQLRMGGNVDLWITDDQNKWAIDSLEFYEANPYADSVDVPIDSLYTDDWTDTNVANP
jgi:beta-lactam-binding protein with PASTA domain